MNKPFQQNRIPGRQIYQNGWPIYWKTNKYVWICWISPYFVPFEVLCSERDIDKWNLLVYFRYNLTGLLFEAGGRQFSPLTILGKEDLTMFLAENRINTSFYKYCPSFSSTVIIYKISRSHAGVYSKKTWREFPF